MINETRQISYSITLQTTIHRLHDKQTLRQNEQYYATSSHELDVHYNRSNKRTTVIMTDHQDNNNHDQLDQRFQKRREKQNTKKYNYNQCLTGVKSATMHRRGLHTEDEESLPKDDTCKVHYHTTTIKSRFLRLTASEVTARPVIQLTGHATITNFFATAPQPIDLPTIIAESNDTSTRPEPQADVHNIN
eukprot:1450827-Amphidinium_carterae.1